MDPFSHATLGAVCALNRKRIRPDSKRLIYPAIVCGVLAGMFPDIDILIRSAEDPLLSLKYHRHFTHSLIFVPFGALIVASLLSITLLRKLPFKEIYWWCFAGMALHGVLDSMTNYGTHLFWPFLERRENWSIISIIDPIFTLTLLACVLACRIKGDTKPARYALVFAVCYWSFGLYQQGQATDELYKLAQARGHQVEKIEVKPSFANLFAWRGQYLTDGMMVADAYHVSPWAGRRVYEGKSLPLFTPSAELLESIGPLQRQDLAYFTFFSDGWVAEFPAGSNIISDMRFATLPNDMHPLWGIQLFPGETDRHITRVSSRKREEGDTDILFGMVKGEQIPQPTALCSDEKDGDTPAC